MKVAIVTGGGRGIGRAIGERLSAEGYAVALGDLDEAGAVEVAEGLAAASGHYVDVADPSSVESFVATVQEEFGPVDVMVNNAGIMPVGPFLAADTELAQRTLDINVHGVLNGMRAALPGMVDRGSGHVVNIASAAGIAGVPGGVLYCASKYAVVGLTEAARKEYAPRGVCVTSVLPSFTNTDLISGTRGTRGIRTVQPADVADAVHRALVKRPRRIFVPRHLYVGQIISGLLPPSAERVVDRLSRADRMFLDIDAGARAGYAERIAGNRTGTSVAEPAKGEAS